MPDEGRIETFVGKNAAYYTEKWRKLDDRSDFNVSFNFAASLGQVIWLAYRKLYVPLFLAVLVSAAYVSLWIYVEDRQLLSQNLSSALSWFVCLLFLAVFGAFGNYWYWKKFKRVGGWAKSQYPDPEKQLRFIRSKGGTSSIGAWLVVIVLLAPIAWAVYQASPVWFAGADSEYSGYIFDATGPLTLAEVRANFIDRMDERLSEKERECVYREVQERARSAGDPEVLDPATVDLLPAESWARLDAPGKRIILAQAITTKAFFVCN